MHLVSNYSNHEYDFLSCSQDTQHQLQWVIEILHNFAKTKGIPQEFIRNLNKDNLHELFSLFTQMFDEYPDSPDLIYLTISLSQDVPSLYCVQALNNLTVLLYQGNLIDSAKRVAKFNLKYFEQDVPQLNIISHLNLARIYYFYRNFAKCFNYTEKSLASYEQYIFKEIKVVKAMDIILLLNGYLFYAKSVQQLQSQGLCQEVDFQQFFINGAKLGRKYLGVNHAITKQFLFSERNSNMKKSLSNYLTNKKFVPRLLNIKKISLQVDNLLRNLKQGKTPVFKPGRHIGRSISEAQGFKLIKRPDSVKPQSQRQEQQSAQKTHSSTLSKGSFRIQSPKFVNTQMPTSDLESLIQRKLDNFMKNQPKKPEPKMIEMEKKIEELTKENKRIQNQRKEREVEIEELKEKITQLSTEASRIKFRLQEQENLQEKLKLQQVQQQQQQQQQWQQQQDQQSLQSSQMTPLQPTSEPLPMQERMSFGMASQNKRSSQLQIKKQDRQSTIDIHNLINGLVDADEPKINSISMINDTDFTIDLNLTIMDQVDQSKQYSINLTTDQTIVKKALIDNTLYEISCGVVQRNKELAVKIQMNTKQENNIPKVEYVELSIIKDLIQYIEYKHVLPYTQQMKCISTFKQFIQYLIIPFISIKDDEGEQKITIYAQPQSLLNDSDKIQLCDEQCLPSLYSLEDGVFRVLLNSLTIDLQFDQSSLDQLFDIYGQDDQEREDVSEMIRMMDNFEKSNDTVKPKHKVYNIRSYILKNQQKFTQLLQKIANDLEELLYQLFNVQKFAQINKILNGTQITMPNKSQAKVQMCLVKIWDKCAFQRIIFIADNTREQCFELLLSNTFETYGPRQSKVKAMGHTQIPYDQVCQKLGLNVSNLDQSDYQLICNILCNCYTLLTFVKELEVDDYDRYKENAILPVELSCECNQRLFISNSKQQYKTPLTISYLGIQDRPIGLRIQIYDILTNTEQGMFLSISREAWDKLEIQVKGKHQRKYTIQNKMSSEYHLPDLLRNGGFNVIKEKIIIDESKTYRLLHGKHISYVDRLENVLNTYSLQEYFNKKLQS